MGAGAAVLLDACVLFPAALRDTLLRGAEVGLYEVRWSDTILREMTRNLVEQGRCTRAQAARLERVMRAAFPDATVTNFEHLIPSLINNPKDRHVLAAAITAKAALIITNNVKDFPPHALHPHGVEVQPPDDFLLGLLDRHPRLVARILEEQARDLGDPPMTVLDVIDELATAVPRFADAVRAFFPTPAPRTPVSDQNAW